MQREEDSGRKDQLIRVTDPKPSPETTTKSITDPGEETTRELKEASRSQQEARISQPGTIIHQQEPIRSQHDTSRSQGGTRRNQRDTIRSHLDTTRSSESHALSLSHSLLALPQRKCWKAPIPTSTGLLGKKQRQKWK